MKTSFNKPYYNEDFNNYIADPAEYKKTEDLLGKDCIPVGINNTFMPTDKYASDNLDKAQYNIRERFGHLQDPEDFKGGV